MNDNTQHWFVRLGMMTQREIDDTIRENRRVRDLLAEFDEDAPDDRAAIDP